MVSLEKHMGGVLGKLFNIGGMGSIILMGENLVKNSKILCYFPIIILVVHAPLVISQLLFVWQTDKISPLAASGVC